MKDWLNISYLLQGSDRQKQGYELLEELKIMEILKPFHPVLVGTLPIDIFVEISDLDIICEVHDTNAYVKILREHFSEFEAFEIKGKMSHTICRFNHRLPIEIYASQVSYENTNSYRHMLIENRLLNLLGESFKDAVVSLKISGLKTEPAFARLLTIDGDPYEGLLALEHISDNALERRYL